MRDLPLVALFPEDSSLLYGIGHALVTNMGGSHPRALATPLTRLTQVGAPSRAGIGALAPAPRQNRRRPQFPLFRMDRLANTSLHEQAQKMNTMKWRSAVDFQVARTPNMFVSGTLRLLTCFLLAKLQYTIALCVVSFRALKSVSKNWARSRILGSLDDSVVKLL
jgi:hypothetical protein